MSTAQRGHDVHQVFCVYLLLTMVQVRVFHLILIYLVVLYIVAFPLRDITDHPNSATLKVRETRERMKGW